MDPVSIIGITTAAYSISASITKLFHRLDALRRRFEGAAFTLNLLRSRLKAVQWALNIIASWATHATEIRYSQQFFNTLNISLDGCNAVLGCLNDHIGRFCGEDVDIRFVDKGKFVWKEDTLKECLEHLNSEILVLNLVLASYQCHDLSEQKDLLQTESSRQAIQNLSKDTRSLQTLVDSQSISAGSNRRLGWTDIDKEFEFDNVLINTHTYRESLASLKRKESSKGVSTTIPFQHPSISFDQSTGPQQMKSQPDLHKPHGRKSMDWLRKLFRRRSTISSMQQSANIISQPSLPLQDPEPLPHEIVEQSDQEIRLSSSSQPNPYPDLVNVPVSVTSNGSRNFGTVKDPNKALRMSNKPVKDRISDDVAQILSEASGRDAREVISPLAKAERYFGERNSLHFGFTDEKSLDYTEFLHMKRHNSAPNRAGSSNHGDGDESNTIYSVDHAMAGSSNQFHPYTDSNLSQLNKSIDLRGNRCDLATAKYSKGLRSKDINTPNPRMETLDEEPTFHDVSAVHEPAFSTIESSSKYVEEREKHIMVTKRGDLPGLKQPKGSNFTERVGSGRNLPSAHSDKVRCQTKRLGLTQDNGERRKSQPGASYNGNSNENEHRKMPGRPGELILSHRNNIQYSGLHGVASAGDRIGIRNFLDEGVDIDGAWPGSGFTALHCAAREGHVAAVTYLLARGAAVHAIDANHHTALHHACALGRARVADALCRKAVSFEILEIADRHGHTALFMCQPQADTIFRLLLLGLGANFRVRDVEGSTPLHWYAYIGDLRKVDVLLKRGAPHEVTTKFGRTVFHSACCGGHVNVVLRLLEEKVDIESQDRSSRRPLHNAACSGHLAIVELLLSKGASPFSKDRSSRTPLSLIRCKIAESSHYRAIGDLLRGHMKQSKSVRRRNNRHADRDQFAFDLTSQTVQ